MTTFPDTVITGSLIGPPGPAGDDGLPGPNAIPTKDAVDTYNGELLDEENSATTAAVKKVASGYANLARTPEELITGVITRDSNGAATSAPVTWPDGTPGNYTADTLSVAFPGAVDGYHITYGSPVTRTYTQPTMTRDSSGAVTTLPAIVVS